jgi:hypothetical protein
MRVSENKYTTTTRGVCNNKSELEENENEIIKKNIYICFE